MALKPEYIQNIPDAMVELYAKAEADILADMARRINTYNYFIPAAEHQMRKLEEMGMVREDIIKELARITGQSEKQLKKTMNDSGIENLKSEDEVYKRAGLSPPPLAASVGLQKILDAGYRKTDKLFRNLTETTANTATKQFEHALDRAYLQIVTGAFDYNGAIRTAIKDLSKKGVAVIEYPTGHVDHMEVAVRRAVITGVNSTNGRMIEARREQMGANLVEVTAHAGARPDHAEWQGGIYWTITKDPDFPNNFYDTCNYGSGDGIYGWNCSHSHHAYFKGMPRVYSDELLSEYQAKNYEYNKIKMTEYEAIQKQRYIERNIRKWKRENLAMSAAKQDTAESAAQIAHWQRVQKDFLKQTGLKRKIDREQIGRNIIKPSNLNRSIVKPSVNSIIKAEGISSAKNFSELRRQLVSSLGIQRISDTIQTLDFQAVKDTVLQMEKVFQRFPQLNGFISELYTSNSGIMSAAPIDKNISAIKISFNPDYYADYKRLVDSQKTAVAAGYHPKGNADISGAHELGHAIEGMLIKNKKYEFDFMNVQAWNECEISKSIVSEACKAAKKLPEGKGMTNAQLIGNVSGYAKSSRSECLAEAVADYFANVDNASVLSKEIMRIIEREMGI